MIVIIIYFVITLFACNPVCDAILEVHAGANVYGMNRKVMK